VGGRHSGQASSAGGGGYLDDRTTPEFRSRVDPRLEDLRVIGLQPYWRRIAEIIGFDAWEQVWRLLEAEPGIRRDDGVMYIPLRSHRSYQRYQRNLFIRSLYAAGRSIREIRDEVCRVTGEKLSMGHLSRIASGG